MSIAETLRGRWRKEWNTVPHLAKARGVFEGALHTIETLPNMRLELGKSGHLSQSGVDAKFREQTAAKTVPELRQSRWELEKTANDLARRRNELGPPAPDPTDLVAAAIRRECREFMRSLPIGEQLGVAISDPSFFAAAMEGPAALSGLTAGQRTRLSDAWSQQNHPERVAALEDEKYALETADTAVRAAVDALRRVAGFENDPKAFDHWMSEASSDVERDIAAEKAGTSKTSNPPAKPSVSEFIDDCFARGISVDTTAALVRDYENLGPIPQRPANAT